MSAQLLLWFVLGALFWTFLEYVIHRWLGHVHRKNIFGAEHTQHHSVGDYFSPWWKKAGAAAAVTATVIGPAIVAFGTYGGIAFTSGLISFYLTYEVLHRLEHTWPGVGPYARWARRHHFHHHFVNPSANHGVTSPIWDFVFGTYEKPTEIHVPERLAMRWLVDDDGELKPGLDPCFKLRKRRKKKQLA